MAAICQLHPNHDGLGLRQEIGLSGRSASFLFLLSVSEKTGLTVLQLHPCQTMVMTTCLDPYQFVLRLRLLMFNLFCGTFQNHNPNPECQKQLRLEMS